MFLTANAPAGSGTIRIAANHYGGYPDQGRIQSGDRIVIVHGPAIDRRNAADGTYYEEHTVHHVQKITGTNPPQYDVTLGSGKGNNFNPETLAHDFGVDPAKPQSLSLDDAIGRLSGSTLSPADYYDAPDALITRSVFPAAFTDYVVLPDSPLVPLPYFGATDQADGLQPFADKWCSVVMNRIAPPGYQLLLMADTDRSQAPDAGVTVNQVAGETSSWVWLGTILQQVATPGSVNYGANPALWAEKTAVHELAHQWKTDGIFNLQDHCPSTTMAYNSATVCCLLAANDPQGSETQRANGLAVFHMLPLPGGAYHSEYYEIRKHADPFRP